MKKSQIFKMLALVTAMMACAACGSSTSNSGTDAATTTDTTDAAGDTTVVVKPLPPPTPWDSKQCGFTYTAPTTNPGCTATDDAAWVKLAADTTAISNNFGDIVADCTLKQGCLAMGGTCTVDGDAATAKAICITDCVQKECAALTDTDPASAKCAKITKGCAWCYGRYSGECGFEKCLSDCAVDSSSDACRACLKANCDGVRDDCKDGKF